MTFILHIYNSVLKAKVAKSTRKHRKKGIRKKYETQPIAWNYGKKNAGETNHTRPPPAYT